MRRQDQTTCRDAAMRVMTALIAAASIVSGCASPTLPYRPERQPFGARISADYTLIQEALRVQIDTDGRQLQDAYILAPDGSPVRAQAIEYPPIGPPTSAVQIGVGFGGGSWGYGGGVGVGTGMSVGAPIGAGQPQGATVATFPATSIGPAPWHLRVKLAGLDEAAIVLGEARPSGGGGKPR
jgi:hypothetical protein